MVGNPDFLAGQDQDNSPEMQELETPDGELYLRFFIPSGDELALPAVGIRQAIFEPPDRITPIPNVSSLLLGTLNMRGRVIWVADLGQFLGDSTPLNVDRTELHVIAVEDQDTMLGLAVDRVGDTQWLNIDEIQMSTDISDTMAPFVRGEWIVKDHESDRRLRLLDQVSILRSARWAA
ncbi:MAG: chemotaxis protein CheW [Prochlorothrix sp.]